VFEAFGGGELQSATVQYGMSVSRALSADDNMMRRGVQTHGSAEGW